jgi:hypothetical protein
MSLEAVLSLPDLHQIHLSLALVVQDRVLVFRLVSRGIAIIVESNTHFKIKISINDDGVNGLNAKFLLRWGGSMFLRCTCPWDPGSRWFNEISDAIESRQMRPLGLLSLSVNGNNLHRLIEALQVLLFRRIEPAIKQLEIAYYGHCRELIAASQHLKSLNHCLTMSLTMRSLQDSSFQRQLRFFWTSSIKILSLSLRQVCGLFPICQQGGGRGGGGARWARRRARGAGERASR